MKGRPRGGTELSDSLRTFGPVLKVLREEANLTQEELAPRVRYSAHYIAKVEQGKRYPPKNLPARAEEPLGYVASRVLTAAYRSLTRRTGLASWFRYWATVEEEALSLYAYECRAIPGLLLPEPYIRAIFERRLRAPYGHWGRTIRVAGELGMRPLGWQLSVWDWEPPGADELVRRMSGVVPRGIILLHDGGGDRSQTVEAVATLIPRLRAEGWTFTVPGQWCGGGAAGPAGGR